MADDPTNDDPKPDPKPDPDAGAKKALDEERKARRDAEKERNDLRAKLKEIEDADKSETERAAAKVAEAERRATEAEAKAVRLEVAAEKGLTPAQAKRLAGSTREELEADAEELLETFGAKSDTGSADEPKPDEPKGPPTNRPTADLKGGTDPTSSPEAIDVAKLAEAIPRP